MTIVCFEKRPEGTATMLPNQKDARNYYRWIVDTLSPYLGKRLLDVGSGYGTHLEYIPLESLDHVLAIDLSHDFVEAMRSRFSHVPHMQVMQFDFGLQDVRAKLVQDQFDTITCLNVLEHIENDVAALRHMREILAGQNGRLLLQVPAHQSLYGAMDSLAGHYRRYGRGALRRALTEAGFQIERLFFFNSFGALPWFVNARLIRPKTLEMGVLNKQLVVYDRYFIPVLRRVESVIRFPLGQSLMAIARAGNP